MTIQKAIKVTSGYLVGASLAMVFTQILAPSLKAFLWTLAIHAVVYPTIVYLYRRFN